MDLTPVVVVGVAGAIAVPIVHAIMRRRGVVDTANHRSSHQGIAVRGLGVACVVGWLAGLAFFADAPTGLWLAVLVGPVVVGAIGLLDDTTGGLAPAARFGLTALVAAAMAAGLIEGATWGWVWVPLGLVWITYFTNAFNFMDGIDGISAATAVVIGGAYAWLAHDLGLELLAQAGFALAASVLGFAALNIVGRGKFLGDAGSYFLGAGLGTLALALFLNGAGAVAVASVAALYVADTAIAIIRRAVRGDAVTQAHREHAYQRLVDAGASHATVSLLAGGVTGVCAVIGIASEGASTPARGLAALAVVALVGGYLSAPLTIRDRGRTARDSSGRRIVSAAGEIDPQTRGTHG